MARHKDARWDLTTPPGMEGAQIAVLMDIRDELKELNALLHCQNFVEIPAILRGIRKKIRVQKSTERHK